ncbi:MAG: hypothetical protein V4683_07820 [Bacteroidota bacterium]
MKLRNNKKMTISARQVACLSSLFLVLIALVYFTYLILFPFSVEIFDSFAQNIAMFNSKLMYRY